MTQIILTLRKIFIGRITDTRTTTIQVAAQTMEVWITITITMGIVRLCRAALGILTRACLS